MAAKTGSSAPGMCRPALPSHLTTWPSATMAAKTGSSAAAPATKAVSSAYVMSLRAGVELATSAARPPGPPAST
eukprot:8591102-Pyramimonas_sp.AAC.2